MNKKALIVSLILVAMSTSSLVGTVVASPYTDIDVETAYNMIMGDAYPDLVVIDIRFVETFVVGHVPRAINVPVMVSGGGIDPSAVPDWIDGEGQNYLNHTIIVCEESYGFGPTAAAQLDDAGFTVHYLVGGYAAWITAGYPVYYPGDAVFLVQNGYFFSVIMRSNSSLSAFNFDEAQKQISFNVTGAADTTGYCNVTIPKDLLKGSPWSVLFNGTDWISSCTITEDDTHTFIHIPYTCSTNTIQITGTWAVPEFSSPTIILLLIVSALVAVALAKIQRRAKTKTS